LITMRSTSRTSAMSFLPLLSRASPGARAPAGGAAGRAGQWSRASATVPAADMRGAPGTREGREERAGRVARAWPWALRIARAALPLAAGPRLAAALDPRRPAVRSLAGIGLWGGWTLVLAA